MSTSAESQDSDRTIPALPVTLDMGDHIVIETEDQVYDGFVATPQEPDFSCKLDLNGIQRTLQMDIDTQEIYLQIEGDEFVRAESFEVVE